MKAERQAHEARTGGLTKCKAQHEIMEVGSILHHQSHSKAYCSKGLHAHLHAHTHTKWGVRFALHLGV